MRLSPTRTQTANVEKRVHQGLHHPSGCQTTKPPRQKKRKQPHSNTPQQPLRHKSTPRAAKTANRANMHRKRCSRPQWMSHGAKRKTAPRRALGATNNCSRNASRTKPVPTRQKQTKRHKSPNRQKQKASRQEPLVRHLRKVRHAAPPFEAPARTQTANVEKRLS